MHSLIAVGGLLTAAPSPNESQFCKAMTWECVFCVWSGGDRNGGSGVLDVRSTTNSGSSGSAVYESARAVDEYLQVFAHLLCLCLRIMANVLASLFACLQS